MKERNVDLVQASFKKVIPIADAAAEIFYGKLFEIDPSLKSMFKNDMKAQGKKLMTTLGMVVAGLKRLDEIVPQVESLAVKHVDYGVKDEDYTKVGNALLMTLKEGLGDEFTQEVREAWIEAYTLLSKTMKEAARKAQA